MERFADGLTLSVPLAPAPVRPFALVIGPVLLTWAPGAVPTTLMTIAQLALAASEAPASAVEFPFAFAVTVPPHELLATTPAAAFEMPVGYVSVNAMPVSG